MTRAELLTALTLDLRRRRFSRSGPGKVDPTIPPSEAELLDVTDVIAALRDLGPCEEMVAKARFALEERTSFTPEHGIRHAFEAALTTLIGDRT